MAEPTNVELAQWLHNGAPETRKAWCELAASQINSHADLVRALEEIQRVSHNDFLTQSERISTAREFARAALATLTARKVG